MGRGKDFRDRQRGYPEEMPEQPRGFGRGPHRSFDRPRRDESPMGAAGPEQQAKVKWFNPDKGFGFVELTDGSGDAFLHIGVVESAGHASLDPGTSLVVRVGQGAKGRQISEIVSVDTSTAEPSRARAPRRDQPPRGRSFDQPSGPAEEVDGRVKWYNPEKGFGFVQVDGGRDVFVHRSVVARIGASALQEGQKLRMSVVTGAKGPEATSIQLADD
jgi:CspA family cold shock protein